MATCSSIGLKRNIQKTITSWKIDWETMVTLTDFILGAPESLQMVTAVMKLKDASLWNKSYDQPRQHIKKQRHYFANKGPSSQSSDFSSSHKWMRVGPKRKLSIKELMLLNCGVGEDS